MLFRKKNRLKPLQTVTGRVERKFDESGFNDILFLIKHETGVDLFSKRDIIDMRIKLFCQKRDIHSFKELYDSLKCDLSLKQELINLITVSETYFFREEMQLDKIVSFVKTIDKKVRILCAPCASGEEVYSIAIKLKEINLEDKFEILGLDINSYVIDKAKRGIYNDRSLHKLNKDIKNRYFTEINGGYEVVQDEFSMVSFVVGNVFKLEKSQIGSFDIILSRNMFIYFDSQTRGKVLEIFYNLLNKNGRLYLGHADSPPKNGWFTESRNDMCYKKVSE